MLFFVMRSLLNVSKNYTFRITHYTSGSRIVAIYNLIEYNLKYIIISVMLLEIIFNKEQAHLFIQKTLQLHLIH